MVASVGLHPSSPGDEGHHSSHWKRVARFAAYAFDIPAVFVRVGDASAHTIASNDEAALSSHDLQAFYQQLAPIEAPIVIEDVTEDERVAAQQTKVRFVAAVPIFDARRQRIGELCLADVVSRSFSSVEIEHLRVFAALAGTRLYPLEGVVPEAPLERIVQQARHGIVVTDSNGQITWVNEGFAQLCGYTPDELLGRKPQDVLQGPQTDADAVATMRERVQDGEEFTTEVVNYRKSGEPYWVRIQAEPIRTEAGSPAGFIAFETDVSEQKAGEETLRLERNMLAAATDTVDAFVVLLDPEGRIVRFNETCRRVTGYDAAEVAGERVIDRLVPEEERAKVQAVMNAHRAGQQHSTFTGHWITKSGERRLIDWSNTVLTGANGDVQYVISTGIDITEQRQWEEFALQMSDIEQQRIGQELRDVIASRLAGTAMIATGITQRFERGWEVTSRDISMIAEQIRMTARQVRALSHSLMPTLPQRDDIGEALRQFAASKEELTGIPMHVEVASDLPSMDEATAMHLYRIAYEAVNNALTRPAPDRIDVRLVYEAGRVVLTVRDEGGRAPGEKKTSTGELRLRIMRRRAEMIRADLSVQSAEQDGTLIRCALSLGEAKSRFSSRQTRRE